MRMQNPIMNYKWGSRTDIAMIQGRSVPSREPEAELWMGAHPKAPSMVEEKGCWIRLDKLIDEESVKLLGFHVVEKFGPRLPYLFKILAAGAPLSIQAHPNLQQAREGFLRENRKGVPIDAFERNYRDNNHKPECICALTEFQGLCGFRQVGKISGLLKQIGAVGLEEVVEDFYAEGGNGMDLKRMYQRLMRLPDEKKKTIIDRVIKRAEDLSGRDRAFEWVLRLGRAYPGDIGLLSPILLNLFHLKPGEALFLPAGELHAYLSGTGIEIMANSDNVLRGGLTPKNVDVEELMNLLTFRDRPISPIVPEAAGSFEHRYPTPAEEFELAVIRLRSGQSHTKTDHCSIEILLCTEGEMTIREITGQADPITVERGASVLVPAEVKGYVVGGEGTFYKATVP